MRDYWDERQTVHHRCRNEKNIIEISHVICISATASNYVVSHFEQAKNHPMQRCDYHSTYDFLISSFTIFSMFQRRSYYLFLSVKTLDIPTYLIVCGVRC